MVSLFLALGVYMVPLLVWLLVLFSLDSLVTHFPIIAARSLPLYCPCAV